VVVWRSRGVLFGRAPDPLAGLIESRGHGIIRESPLAMAEIVLVATCVEDETIERMREPETIELDQVAVLRLRIEPFEASAPAKLRRALQHLGHGRQQAYQARSSGGGDRLGTGDTH
jgi:serine kinase of HPr protein (carbohydrate metabolism regulator)